MAEILAIDGPFFELSKLIDEAHQFLLLVSPYICFTPGQLRKLYSASKRGVEITIVFRYFESSEDAQIRSSFLDETFDFPNIKIIACPDLHAKIYANEKAAILTSRNLYERKEGSSIEVGVHFTKIDDPQMYLKLLELAKEISEFDECEIIVDNINLLRRRRYYRTPQWGYCIRCRDKIVFNPNRPYCLTCYNDWLSLDGGNKSIKERFCHRCGMRKGDIWCSHPQDRDCYYQ